ncbi:hypothetical protein KFE25_005774 [Diacronema lutheri]|uniref:Peptidase M12B domain-containing protein n=3 Tax=Diacronema lutheri TaxID=2081491 RepID=A0A8J6C3U8_DIALT|nr:hypothetical protein KFE25_005774 [Diacronema lutheri]
MMRAALMLALGASVLAAQRARTPLRKYQRVTDLRVVRRGLAGAPGDDVLELAFTAGVKRHSYELQRVSTTTPNAQMTYAMGHKTSVHDVPPLQVWESKLPNRGWIVAHVRSDGRLNAVFNRGLREQTFSLTPADSFELLGDDDAQPHAGRALRDTQDDLILVGTGDDEREAHIGCSGSHGGKSGGNSGARRALNEKHEHEHEHEHEHGHGHEHEHAHGVADHAHASLLDEDGRSARAHGDARSNASSVGASRVDDARRLQDQFGGRLPGCTHATQEVPVSFLVDSGFTARVMAGCAGCDEVTTLRNYVQAQVTTMNQRYEEQLGIRIVINPAAGSFIVHAASAPANSPDPSLGPNAQADFGSVGPNYKPPSSPNVLADQCRGAQSFRFAADGYNPHPDLWLAGIYYRHTTGVPMLWQAGNAWQTGILAQQGAFAQWIGDKTGLSASTPNAMWQLLTDCHPQGQNGIATIGWMCAPAARPIRFLGTGEPFTVGEGSHWFRLSNFSRAPGVGANAVGYRPASACSSNEFACRAPTSVSSYIGDNLNWKLMAHEMGHSMGGDHTDSGLMLPYLGPPPPTPPPSPPPPSPPPGQTATAAQMSLVFDGARRQLRDVSRARPSARRLDAAVAPGLEAFDVVNFESKMIAFLQMGSTERVAVQSVAEGTTFATDRRIEVAFSITSTSRARADAVAVAFAQTTAADLGVALGVSVMTLPTVTLLVPPSPPPPSPPPFTTSASAATTSGGPSGRKKTNDGGGVGSIKNEVDSLIGLSTNNLIITSTVSCFVGVMTIVLAIFAYRRWGVAPVVRTIRRMSDAFSPRKSNQRAIPPHADVAHAPQPHGAGVAESFFGPRRRGSAVSPTQRRPRITRVPPPPPQLQRRPSSITP